MNKTLLVRLSANQNFPMRARGSDLKQLCFSDRRQFDRFLKFMSILAGIRANSPCTVYGLAKLLGKDVANLAKIVAFYEALGVITMKKVISRGRKIQAPMVVFDRITFAIDEASELKAGRAVLAIVRRR